MNFANKKFFLLDTKCFKAFMAVAEFGHFAHAADEAAMSQSALSEHIGRLKSQVGSDLFVKRESNYELTDVGQELHRFIQQLSDLSSEFHQHVVETNEKVSGTVRYALPPSCLFSPHFPMLLEKRKDHDGLELKVELIPSDEVLKQVESRTYDFGFVTEEVAHPSLEYQVFCEEEYILVSSDPDMVHGLDGEKLIEQRYINYPGMGLYFNLWRQHFYPGLSKVTDRSLYHSGDINTIDGAIKMVCGGLGISVFPRHCVQELIESGALFEPNVGDSSPLLNPIHIVRRKTPEVSKRVQTVINWFFDMHPEYSDRRAEQKANA